MSDARATSLSIFTVDLKASSYAVSSGVLSGFCLPTFIVRSVLGWVRPSKLFMLKNMAS